MSNYYDDSCYVLRVLREFQIDVNDFLPDTPDGDDYAFPWDKHDKWIVWDMLATTIDRILSTKFANHVTYELTSIRNDYFKAVRDGDVKKCQKILNNAMKEFKLLYKVCYQFKKKYQGRV